MEKAVSKHTACHRYPPVISSSNFAFASLSGVQESLACYPSRRWVWSKGKLLWLTETNGQHGPNMRNSSKGESFLIFISVYKLSALLMPYHGVSYKLTGSTCCKDTTTHSPAPQHAAASSCNNSQWKAGAQKELWPTSSLLPNKLDVQPSARWPAAVSGLLNSDNGTQ